MNLFKVMEPINIFKQFEKINELFSPKVIAEVNDIYVKLAIIKGDQVPWHNHKDEDELFCVISGSLLFEEETSGSKNKSFTMNEGDVYVVKRGIEHRVSSEQECKILLIENKTTAHTGDIKSDITKSIDQQLQ